MNMKFGIVSIILLLSLLSAKASAIEVGDRTDGTRVIGTLQVPLEISFDGTSLIEHGTKFGVMKGEKAAFTLMYDQYPHQLPDGALTVSMIKEDALNKCRTLAAERERSHIFNQYGREIDQYRKGYRAFLPPLAVATSVNVEVYSGRVFCTVETRLYPSVQACSTMDRGCTPAFRNILD
jgi:hypothetical protein